MGKEVINVHRTLNRCIFSEHMSYRRNDDLLISTGTGEGMSNPLLEGDNEVTKEEEDMAYEEHSGEEDD